MTDQDKKDTPDTRDSEVTEEGGSADASHEEGEEEHRVPATNAEDADLPLYDGALQGHERASGRSTSQRCVTPTPEQRPAVGRLTGHPTITLAGTWPTLAGTWPTLAGTWPTLAGTGAHPGGGTHQPWRGPAYHDRRERGADSGRADRASGVVSYPERRLTYVSPARVPRRSGPGART